MRTLAKYARLYVRMISQYMKARMSYRADFFISIIGMLAINASGIVGIWVIFNNIPALKGWDLHELIFLYGFSLLSLTPLQLFFDNIWSLRHKVTDGTFLKYYLRPVNMMFYYMSEVFDMKGFAQLALGIFLVSYASTQMAVQWTFLGIIQLIALILTSSLVMTALLIIAASSAFWIVNSFAVIDFFNRFRDFTRYPLNIFNTFFQIFFTFVIPIGFVAFYPVELLLHPDKVNIAAMLSPIAGIVLFAFSYLIWNKGTAAWTGTGS